MCYGVVSNDRFHCKHSINSIIFAQKHDKSLTNTWDKLTWAWLVVVNFRTKAHKLTEIIMKQIETWIDPRGCRKI